MPINGPALKALVELFAVGSYGVQQVSGDPLDTDAGSGLTREIGYDRPGGGTVEGQFKLVSIDLGESAQVDWSTFQIEGDEADSTKHEYKVKATDTAGFDITTEPLLSLASVLAKGVETGRFIHVLVDMEIGVGDANLETTFRHATVNVAMSTLLIPTQICTSSTVFPNNTIDGYQKLTDNTAIPEFVVEGLVGPAAIPLSVLRAWSNDFGRRFYGGAQKISIFEKGGNETTPGTLIKTVNQDDIDLVGTVDILQLDVERRYEVVVRLRSALNDPNYRDFEFPFYVHTQQGSPTRVTLLADDGFPSPSYDPANADFPEMEYDDSDDQFHWVTEPHGDINEAWVRTGQGRAALPVSGTPWTDPFSADAKNHILKLFQQGGGYFAVDFQVDTISAVTRIFYEVVATGGSPSLTLFKRKRANFTIPGFDNALVPADIAVNIDRDAGTAELVIDTIQPDTADLKYETISVAGSKGSITLNPASAKYGGTYDISSVVDFNQIHYSPRLSYADDTVTVMLVTDSKVTVYRVPFVEEEPLVIARTSDPIINPPGAAMVWRHMAVGGAGDFIRWENEAVYTNPPEVSLITITEVDTGNTAVYATHAALSAVLSTQNFGIEGAALPDCLDLGAEGILGGVADSTHGGWLLDYTLDDGVSPQTLRQYIPARFGETATVLSSSATSQIDLVYGTMDPWPNLVLQMTALTIDSMVVRGDLGTYTLTSGERSDLNSGDVTIDARAIVSREADVITLSYQVNAGDFIVVHLPRYPDILLVSGNPIYKVDVFFSNDALIFPAGSLAGKLDTTQTVVVTGDRGSQTILPAIQENSLYDMYWSGIISSSLFTPYVEISYTDVVAGTVVLRVPNRLGNNHKIQTRPFIEAPKGGWGMNGLYARALQGHFPAAKIDPGTQEIIFDTTKGGGIQYDHVACFNTRTGTWFNIVGDQVRPLQGGYAYQLGAAGVGMQIGDYLSVTFRHTTGTQGVALYKIDKTYHEAERADRLQGRF